MTATIAQARDEMLALFTAEWTGDPASQNIYVDYEDVAEAGEKPDDISVPWVRVSVQHNPLQPGNVTINGRAGQKRFRRNGIISMQIFTGVGDGLKMSDNLSTIARRAFEGKSTTPGDVIFRAVSVNEVGVEDRGWYQTNVTANFEYDEIL